MQTSCDEKSRVDPLFRFAYDNLPDRIQRQIQLDNPRAVQRLYAEYERLRSGAPNRSLRRQLARRGHPNQKGKK